MNFRLRQMKQEIIDVMDYKSGSDSCNSVYVGGLATAHVISVLGGSYGKDSFKGLIEEATGGQIQKVHEYLKSYINYMLANPINKCPHCGQIMQR